MVAQLRKLLEPGRIGTLPLANRVVMPPIVTEYAEEGGRRPSRKGRLPLRGLGENGLGVAAKTGSPKDTNGAR